MNTKFATNKFPENTRVLEQNDWNEETKPEWCGDRK
jgi:hypothetical protein